jgi:hypothetical protein
MRILLLLAILALMTACGADDDAGDGQDETPPPATSTTTAVTTTSADTTTGPAETSTSAPRPTETTEAQPAMTECASPEGYAIRHPESWSTNPGDVVPACSLFDPEPFEVPEGTDERVAAVGVFVDPVPFAEAAAPEDDRDADRAVTAVDGLQAVRLEYQADGDGLWPAGTPITRYAVDVSSDEAETLHLDTIGLAQFDYEDNQSVLDRMARTLDVQMEGVPDDPGVVASYRGGGGAFTVEGRVSNSRACLRIPPDGEEVCTDVPASDQLHTIQLAELQPVLAGVTGSDVFAVTADLREGGRSTVLPAPIGAADVGGFSFTVGPDAIDRLVLSDVGGDVLGTVEAGG